MRLYGIEIYRDGGSIEFFIEEGEHTRQVWLDTPFRSEPRRLLVDSIPLQKGDSDAKWLCSMIETWWTTLPLEVHARILDLQQQTEPIINPDETTLEASNLGLVRFVGDYIAEFYL